MAVPTGIEICKLLSIVSVIQNVAHKLEELIKGMKYNNFTAGTHDLRSNPEQVQYRVVNVCIHLQCRVNFRNVILVNS